MALIILPRKNDYNTAKQDAQLKFNVAIDDPFTVLMVVYGEGPETPRILEVCSARASIKAAIRRVVWIPDPTVLSDEQMVKYAPKTSAAASIGIDNKIAKRLTKSRAKITIHVERAFLTAESQGGES